ncbi:MAG: serine/threonine protein kinase, partial [Chitinispirillaceae bacterium]|nr:serine/threonine protein kinase [Chitinispirillaceae bacterium]
TAKLHHRNIIEIHAVGHWNSLPYIEMERITGDTLEKLLDQRGALPVEVSTAIGIMIGRALWYAHNQNYIIYGTTYHGVIHRDLKPSNIMIADDGVVKLMDFGIARPTDASIHTTDGAILGTMQYLSPEQLDGKDPDIRTDIYSLGTILYELLTGVKAFPEQNISKLMLSKIKNDFRSLELFDVRIPSRLRRLVHRCMTYDREKRISDTQAFLTEISKIHRIISGLSPEQVVKQFIHEEATERIVITSRRRLPRRAIAAGALMAVVSLGIWVGERTIQSRIEENQRTKAAAPALSGPQHLPPPEKPLSEASPPEEKTVAEKTGDETKVKETPRAGGSRVTAGKKKTVIAGPPPLLDRLRERYTTGDLLTIFTKEVQQRHYQDALKVFEALPAAEAASARAVVYRIRALRALGKTAALRSALADCTIEDGEIHLERARLAFGDNNVSATLAHLKSCERAPSAFMESGALRLERLCLEARCAGLKFSGDRSEESRRFALDRWYEVKSELRTARDHPYFREAEVQMQRIAGK